MISASFDFVVGSDNNLMKGVCAASQSFANINPVTDVSPALELTRLAWSDETDSVYFGRSDGHIGCMNFKKSILEINEKLDSAIVGMDVIDKKKLVVCTKNGSVLSYFPNKSSVEKLNCSPGQELFSASIHRQSSSQMLMATGGRQNDLKLFDLSSGKKEPIFRAKNIANDWLSLEQPIWIRNIDFISSKSHPEQLPKIATVNDNGFLRIYDTKAQRRPVVNVSLVDHPLTCLAVFPSDTTSSSAPLPFIAAGSAHGWLGIVDLRQPRAAIGQPLPGNCITRHRLVGRCHGLTGSVRSVTCLPRKNGKPVLVSSGLDRFVRVFDSSQPKLGPMAKIYTKSKITSLAVNPKINTDKLFEALSVLVEENSTNFRKRPRFFEDDPIADGGGDEKLPDLVIDDDDDAEDDNEDEDDDFESDDDDDDDDDEDSGEDVSEEEDKEEVPLPPPPKKHAAKQKLRMK